MRSRLLAIIVAIVVPLAALGIVITRSGSSHTPKRLPILVGGAQSAATGRAPADAALAPYGGIVYKAGPNLPALDGSARAYTIVGADSGAERRLADAFGFTGVEPDANATFIKGDEQLTVSAGGYWGYSRQSSGGAVASSGEAVACAPDAECPIPSTTIPQHPADLPSQDDAKATAIALLQTAGISTSPGVVTVDDAVTQWIVRVDPVVDGLATEGFATTVTVGERSVIEYANGILGRPEAADEYPLIGTSRAIDRLNNGEGFIGPRPLGAARGIPALGGATAAQGASSAGAGSEATGGASTDAASSASAAPGSIAPGEPVPLPPCDGTGAPTTRACGPTDTEPPPVGPPVTDTEPSPVEPPVTDTLPPAPPPQEITITGAQTVLLFAGSYDGTQSFLVPGYRFTASQGPGPTVLAVDDSFLTPPDQVPTGKNSRGSDGSVTVETAPVPAPPPAPASDGGS